MKQNWFIFLPLIALGTLWVTPSAATQSTTLRVDKALIIQRVDGEAYILHGNVARLAQPGVALTQVGAGIQTGRGRLTLTLDTQTGTIRIAPHSQLRVRRIIRRPNGGKQIEIQLQQGNIRLHLPDRAPIPSAITRPTDAPPMYFSGVRA